MPYLIFTTYEDAVARNDDAGKAKGLAFHSGTGVTRWPWRDIVEDGNEPRCALEIVGDVNLLTEDEKEHLAENLPADWQQETDNP